MLTSLILATFLILATLILLITLDRTSTLFEKTLKKLLLFTRRSKQLTAYLLKAYLAYRRNMQTN